VFVPFEVLQGLDGDIGEPAAVAGFLSQVVSSLEGLIGDPTG